MMSHHSPAARIPTSIRRGSTAVGREKRKGVGVKQSHRPVCGNGVSRQNDRPWFCGLGLHDVGLLCGEAPRVSRMWRPPYVVV